MSSFWDNAAARVNAFVRDYVAAAADAGWFVTRTLDFGCGDQPYRRYVAGEYEGYDKMLVGGAPILAPFDFILCTHVLQEVEDPDLVLTWFRTWIADGGGLLISVPMVYADQNGPPTEEHLFTLRRLTAAAERAGFTLDDHEACTVQIHCANSDMWQLPEHRVGSPVFTGELCLAIACMFRAKERRFT